MRLNSSNQRLANGHPRRTPMGSRDGPRIRSENARLEVKISGDVRPTKFVGKVLSMHEKYKMQK